MDAASAKEVRGEDGLVRAFAFRAGEAVRWL